MKITLTNFVAASKCGLAIATLTLAAVGPMPTAVAGADDSAWKAAAANCASSVGIAVPESHEAFKSLEPAAREKFHQCMRASNAPPPPRGGGPGHLPPEMKQAMDACLASKGIEPPAEGERPSLPPSEAQRQAFHDCRNQIASSNTEAPID